jgi:hypothetical protein
MFRLYWSLSQAIWSTSGWLVIVAVMSSMFVVDKRAQPLWFEILIVVVCVGIYLTPLLYRWRQFYRMYAVHFVVISIFNEGIEIGHRRAMTESYKKDNRPEKLHAILLDNGMVMTCSSLRELEDYQCHLSRSGTYKTYFSLIENFETKYLHIEPDGELVSWALS